MSAAGAGGGSGAERGGEIGSPLSRPRARRLKVVGLVVIVVGVALDLASKAWLQDHLWMDPSPSRGGTSRRVEVIEGFFALEGTWNPGVTFGLAPNQTDLILALTAAATLGLVVWFLATRSTSRLLHAGLAMIIGGAFGNLYDRLRWAKVRDFFLFYVGDWKWPNFNVADSLIVVGVGFVIWDALFGHRPEAKPEPVRVAP
jgi:signal peptidase II